MAYLTTGDKFMQEKNVFRGNLLAYPIRAENKKSMQQGVVSGKKLYHLFTNISTRMLLDFRVQLV